MAGFSSGGGFVLRYAASAEAKTFQSFLLLSPFVHQSAPTQRENSGGWVRVGVPRLILLQALNGMGLSQLNQLAVTRFAIDEANRDLLTRSYDFNLTANFRPRDDYQTSIRAVTQPLMVLAGDEASFQKPITQTGNIFELKIVTALSTGWSMSSMMTTKPWNTKITSS